jgi:hypothetical protein
VIHPQRLGGGRISLPQVAGGGSRPPQWPNLFFFFFFGLPETLLEVGVWAGLVGLFDQVFYSYFKYLHFS